MCRSRFSRSLGHVALSDCVAKLWLWRKIIYIIETQRRKQNGYIRNDQDTYQNISKLVCPPDILTIYVV